MSDTSAPWFEDLSVGDDFSDVPAVTVTDAHNVIHQAIFGDRLRLPIDHLLSKQVTGFEQALANPSMVCNIAIGQSTIPSQRVMGNLFYRGLVLQRPVFVGDTLTTTTRVVALKQNRHKAGRPASGMVVLKIHMANQKGETVLEFWRCPMIPCRDPRAHTSHDDDFSIIPAEITQEALDAAVPGSWDISHLQSRPCNIEIGSMVKIEARDTVTLAPELVRLTLNMAMTHTDANRSVYGKRLVYGGHTIAMAAAQISRVIPDLITILGWYHCDHVAPVFEGDILRSQVTPLSLHPVTSGSITVLQVETFGQRGNEAPESGDDIKVLDWCVAVLRGGKD
ncbi:MAG: MaoC family dehydratase [Pseudomonadales bacterium]